MRASSGRKQLFLSFLPDEARTERKVETKKRNYSCLTNHVRGSTMHHGTLRLPSLCSRPSLVSSERSRCHPDRRIRQCKWENDWESGPVACATCTRLSTRWPTSGVLRSVPWRIHHMQNSAPSWITEIRHVESSFFSFATTRSRSTCTCTSIQILAKFVA